jgi:homocitrate synthase
VVLAAGQELDPRPTILTKVTGHLFDKALLNRMLDIIVDSPCSFEVESLFVPGRNEDVSEAGVCRCIG